MKKIDTSILIDASKKGDRDAFEQLSDIHIQSLRRFCLTLTGDNSRANDLVQETLIKAFIKIEQYKENISFGGWLKSLGRNLYIDYIRSGKIKNNLYLSEHGFDNMIVDEDTDYCELKEDIIISIEKSIKSLSKDYKEVLNMRYFQDMSYQDIADKMNVPISTIKTRLHRAKQELKRNIGSSKNSPN